MHASSIYLNGEPHIQVITRDISNRLLLEAKFERSETKFRDVFDSMIDLFLRVNNDGVMEMVSPSVFHITGYKADEIIGKKAKDYYENSKDRDNLIKIVQEKGFCHGFEAAIITKEGIRKVLSINARIYSDSNGEPRGIESISRDITKQKEIKQNLRNSISEFKDLFESSGDEICLIEPNSMKIVKVNETLCHVTGYTKKELEGKKLTDFFPMTELIKNTDRFNNVLKYKTEVFQTQQKKKMRHNLSC